MKKKINNIKNKLLDITSDSDNYLDINVYGIGVVKATKIKTFEDIKKSKRLFYEQIVQRDRKTGFFIEIKDISIFIEAEKELQKNNIKHNCSDKEYIDWHNFHATF